jgi:hypothetical protein
LEWLEVWFRGALNSQSTRGAFAGRLDKIKLQDLSNQATLHVKIDGIGQDDEVATVWIGDKEDLDVYMA